MKKCLIAGSIILSMGVASSAQAFDIDITSMTFGSTSAASGTIDNISMGDTFSGTFFAAPWVATTEVFYSQGSGTNTWSGTTVQGDYSYNFTLTGTQFAFGVLFDWSVNYDIPVLMIMDCGSANPVPGDVCTGIGTPMQIGPFPGQAPSFNGVFLSPVTAAFISDSTVSVNENIAETGYVAEVNLWANEYSISAGADRDLFVIDSVTGVLSFISPPDFENPADADGNNNYEVTVDAVRYEDPPVEGFRISQQVTIAVMDVLVETLHFVDYKVIDNAVFAENQMGIVYDADAISSNGNVVYSLGGVDASSFAISTTTGEITFVTSPDYETKTSYEITVTASDGADPDASLNLTVNIQDVNDVAPVFTSSGAFTVEENISYRYFVNLDYTATVTDSDTVGDITFSISGGADASQFSINSSTGRLGMRQAPDFEAPTDADGDNVYEIIITASDGVSTTELNLTITVTDVNEAPAITINGDTSMGGILIGSSYVDAGATAYDIEDGDLTAHIVTTSTVDTSVPGSYRVTYTVTDSGGITSTATRSVSTYVNVLRIDVTEMVFGDVYPASGQISSYSLGQTFYGSFFGQPWEAMTVAFYSEGSGSQQWAGTDSQGAFEYNFVLTGTQFAFGTYFDWSTSTPIPVLVIMDCGSFDPAPGDICTGIGTPMQVGPFPGQAPAFNGVVSQPVGTLPEIVLNGASTINLQLGDVYVDPGATATDAEDGDLTATIVVSSSVDVAVEDVYTVVYRVSDSDNNNAYVTRTVIVGNLDIDGDGLWLTNDNCLTVANPNQRDTDSDGYGNFCDADFNNDNMVNSIDLGIFKQRFFTEDADADLNGDGFVNSLDLGLFKKMYFKQPGPSGLVP